MVVPQCWAIWGEKHVHRQLKDRQGVVVDRHRHGHVPTPEVVHRIVVGCIVLTMCSGLECDGKVDLSCGTLGCVRSVSSLRLVEFSVCHPTQSVRC